MKKIVTIIFKIANLILSLLIFKLMSFASSASPSVSGGTIFHYSIAIIVLVIAVLTILSFFREIKFYHAGLLSIMLVISFPFILASLNCSSRCISEDTRKLMTEDCIYKNKKYFLGIPITRGDWFCKR